MNREIAVTGKQVLEYWDSSLTAVVLDLDVNYIDKLTADYLAANKTFTAYLRPLLRLVLRRRYRRIIECMRMLEAKLKDLPVRKHLMVEPGPQLSRGLLELQQLARRHRDLAILLAKLNNAEQEIAAGSRCSRYPLAPAWNQAMEG